MYELDWMGLRRVLAAAVQNKKEALSAEQSLLLVTKKTPVYTDSLFFCAR